MMIKYTRPSIIKVDFEEGGKKAKETEVFKLSSK